MMKEWKRLNKKGKAALIALVLGGSLCGVSSAEAAVLAVTIPSDYANSELGYVTGSRVTDHVDEAPVAGYVQGLNRDPGLYRANINGKSVLLLRQYTYSTTDLKPLQLLDVNGDLRKPIASGIIKNADNPHSAASNGDYVFTANYDTGSITGAKIVGDKLQDSSEMMITSERFKRDLDTAWGAGKAPLTYGVDEEVTLHGEGLYMLGNHLFVAYNANPKDAGWMEYKDGVLAQYDIEKGNKLVFKGAAKIAKNCDSVSINRYNNHFILNGIGGFQHYGDQMNEESGVSIVTTQPGIGLSNPAENSRNAVIPKNVRDLRNTHFADFYDTKVTSNGTAYILAYGLGTGNIKHLYVFKTTVSNLMAEHPEDWELVLERGESDGWFGRIKYDQYTKRFWAEIGNELSVFKDGASDPSHTWKAKDFATNEQYYQFNSVVAPDGDTVAGDLAVYHKFVPEGISSYENAKIEFSEDAETDDEAMTGDYDSYELESDYKVERKEGVGDPKTNVYAGIFARDDDDVIINGSKNVLFLELTNDIGSPVGIYAGNGKNVKLNDLKGLIVKTTVNVAPEYGNSITNAIWNDPGVDKASVIEIKGPVKIQLVGGHGGNGLAVMKTDRWGENSFKSDKTSSIIVHGDVTIQNDQTDKWGIPGNLDNVYSRFNNAGILTRVNNSKVIVDGNVDFSIYGNGVTTNATGSSVQLGGGSIVVPKGMKYGYYTLAAYNGNIYMNTGAEGKTPGTSTVQLDGDIFALSTGKISVALTDKNSYLHGIADNGGEMNLWLQNGAQWINKAQNKRYVHDDEDKGAGEKSHISRLTGGNTISEAGVIFQKDEKDITIDSYSGHTMVVYGHDTANPKRMIGGDTIITKAQAGSGITLRTDNSGLNMESDKVADKNLVNETLNALANKLYYTAYKDGEKNLTGKVEIAEGLTAQSASKRIENMTFKDANGQGQYLFTPAEDKPDIPDAQTETAFGKAILGSAERDTLYVNTGVLKDGVYHFTKPETTIKIDGTKDEKENKRDMVLFGPWFSSVQAAISGSVPMYDENGNKATYDAKTVVANSAEIDMHGNRLNVDVKYTGGVGQTGISAIAPMNRVEGAGKVNIKNAGAMNVNVRGSGMTAGLFADGGGKLHIYNGGEDLEGKVLTIRAGSKSKNSGVGIKTMNGNIKAESGVNKHSEITIDGLVDVIADGKADAEGYASNEAVSAVASDINIGGGSIKAVNGAWAAIRAYGEFTTPNYGIVNVNAANRVYTNEEGTAMGGKVQVHKVSDFEIGDNKAVIEGDIVTNGGMGTKGQVNIGLKDKDSHWIGNYADTAGYGVTKGSFGAVNIKMKDGAYWKGFGNGSMNIQMAGKDTYWLGFSLQDKMQLTLKDGATWYNAITPGQKDQKGNPSTAKIGYLTSDKGIINMSGSTTFTASSESLNGHTTADNPSGIVESENGITGNVEINNYKGNGTVIYRHDKTDPKKMIGGDFTINNAEENSMITFRTDNSGLNMGSGKAEDKNLVNETLNALANKLYYTAYKDGEKNLKGKVEIAEGLTAQSASKRLENMTFKDANGQGQYLFTPAVDPNPNPNPNPGTKDMPVIYGPKQTAMMRGAKSAMTTTMLSMRDNMTTMTQRLGDIHEGTEDGIWARTYGGKANYDKDQTKTKESFWGVQMGADKKQKSGWHTGVSFDYQDGNATYELGGKGDPKLYTLGIYGTKVKDNGEYIDVVAKAGRGQNDYTVYNDMGHKLKGDYKANAMGLSVEYGKRIEKGDNYLTPQIQLSYMKLQGTDYDAISDYAGGKKMHVKQDGMTSLVGRIGIAAGKRTDKTDLYLKANLLHEFKGTTASTFSAENERTGKVDQDFGDTWAELSIGVNHNIDKDKMIYADITKSIGGDYEMEWKANAGIRLRF